MTFLSTRISEPHPPVVPIIHVHAYYNSNPAPAVVVPAYRPFTKMVGRIVRALWAWV